MKTWERCATWFCWSVFGLSLAAFGVLAAHSPVASDRRYEEALVLTRLAQAATPDMACEEDLAEIYWNRNRDVADSGFFGREGALGVFGAREHFDRHGRREGRAWPDRADHCSK